MDDLDYYKILEVEPDAGIYAITRAYQRLAPKWHPSRNPDKLEEATKKFQLIDEAHTILTDPVKRSVYDRIARHALNNDGPSVPYYYFVPTPLPLPPSSSTLRLSSSVHSFTDVVDGKIEETRIRKENGVRTTEFFDDGQLIYSKKVVLESSSPLNTTTSTPSCSTSDTGLAGQSLFGGTSLASSRISASAQPSAPLVSPVVVSARPSAPLVSPVVVSARASAPLVSPVVVSARASAPLVSPGSSSKPQKPLFTFGPSSDLLSRFGLTSAEGYTAFKQWPPAKPSGSTATRGVTFHSKDWSPEKPSGSTSAGGIKYHTKQWLPSTSPVWSNMQGGFTYTEPRLPSKESGGSVRFDETSTSTGTDTASSAFANFGVQSKSKPPSTETESTPSAESVRLAAAPPIISLSTGPRGDSDTETSDEEESVDNDGRSKSPSPDSDTISWA